MSLQIGQQLDSYEITALLGKGGMGEVYRARDTKLKRDVAIKILPDEFSRDPNRVSRFQREAEVLASLNHPNIAAIYDLQEANAIRFLIMELVEGETLADRIQRGPIPVNEALDIAMHVADALEAAHEKGVVHRDLKPGNIKVTSAGKVKVLDFGLAKAMESAPTSTTLSNSPTMMSGTMAGLILGTASYMSPEQARGKPVDKRSDIWAFGVVLYEMLTGALLFQGDTLSDTLAAVLRHDIDWKRIPPNAERLLRGCLERDPNLRLRDIGDMRWLLENAPRQDVPLSSRLLSRLEWSAAALAFITMAVAFILQHFGGSTDLPLVRLNVDFGPEFFPSGSFAADVSPDGTKLLYRVRTSDRKTSLAIRPLDHESALLLPGTEEFGGPPSFSPDGKWVAFVADGKLKKVPVQGGAAIELCESAGLGVSWGEGGNIVLPLTVTSGLSRVPEGGGPPQPLTKLAEGEATHRYPQVLPGANAVLFTVSSSLGNFDEATIHAVSLKTGQRKTLVKGGYFGRYVPSNEHRGHLIYIHQRTLFAVPFDPSRLEIIGNAAPIVNDTFGSDISGAGLFGVSGAGSHSGVFVYREAGARVERRWQVLWLDSTGKSTPLVNTPGTYMGTRLSPDGQRLALSVATGKGLDIFIYDIGRDKMSPLTFNGDNNRDPVWTPDGKHLAFGSNSGIWWIRTDGGGEAQPLLSDRNTPSPYSFSPDGKRLAYSRRNSDNTGTGLDIWTLPFDSSDPEHPKPQKPEIFLNSSAAETMPAFSPDGRWIAYIALDSGEQALWVRAFPGPGGRWRISTGGGVSIPIWSRTVPQLFFSQRGQIMVLDYTANNDSFLAGNARPWSEFEAFQPGGAQNVDLAPDGKRFVIFDRPVGNPQVNTHLTLLLNFFDELQRRAPEGK